MTAKDGGPQLIFQLYGCLLYHDYTNEKSIKNLLVVDPSSKELINNRASLLVLLEQMTGGFLAAVRATTGKAKSSGPPLYTLKTPQIDIENL